MILTDFEEAIVQVVDTLVTEIVKGAKPVPAGKTDRPGAALGGNLADAFVTRAQRHPLLVAPEAPTGKQTKNPWDARFFVKVDGREEEIWLDFKVFDQSADDSNPDSGSVDKFRTFLTGGLFYFLFVRTFFKRNVAGEFVHVARDGKWCHTFLLRDIPSKFRRTSGNQLQMNASAQEHKRSREEFVNDFFQTVERDYRKEIRRLEDKLAELDGYKEATLRAVADSEKATAQVLETALRDDPTWIERLVKP